MMQHRHGLRTAAGHVNVLRQRSARTTGYAHAHSLETSPDRSMGIDCDCRLRLRSLTYASLAQQMQMQLQLQLHRANIARNNHRHGRFMSDNLLGHSPMGAAAAVNVHNPMNVSSSDWQIPTKGEAEVIGVWSSSNGKREKLGELRLELQEGQATLEDAATPEQRLDLDLVNGLSLVAQTVDQALDIELELDSNAAGIKNLLYFLQSSEQSRTKHGSDMQMTRDQYNAHLAEAKRLVDLAKETLLASSASSDGRTPSAALALVRDFESLESSQSSISSVAFAQPANNDKESENDMNMTEAEKKKFEATASAQTPFETVVAWHRLQLLESCLTVLQDSWDILTTVTDGDLDRAATRGESADPPTTLHIQHINNVIRSHAEQSCNDRFNSFWKLMDRDQDGIIDQAEMNQVALLTTQTVQQALLELFQHSIAAHPVRSFDLPTISSSSLNHSNNTPTPSLDELQLQNNSSTTPLKKKPGWRQRRKDQKLTKNLLKSFDVTMKRHFDIQVELPHRLRCIYVWAEKAHQNNKIDSVLVDSGSNVVMGRKRYVELQPKISLDEFRRVQSIHLTQLDCIGSELMTAFHDDLLIEQGKGRQNSELKRHVAIFVTIMAGLDVVLHNL